MISTVVQPASWHRVGQQAESPDASTFWCIAAQDVFDTELIDAVAKGSTDQTDDLDVAKAPARLVHDESRAGRVATSNTSGHLVTALL